MPAVWRWLCVAVGWLCLATGGVSTVLAGEAAFPDLRAQAERDGAVRVIVRLREGHVPEAWLGSAQRADQRMRIAQGQARVLERLGRGQEAGVRRFQTMPYLALALTAEELDALRGSEMVAELLPDRVLRRALANSTSHIGAPVAWNLGYTGGGQTIAIMDDGVEKDHPFLAGKVVAEACYLAPAVGRDGPQDACPDEIGAQDPGAAVPPEECENCEHGTHVAGIAAGLDAGKGFSGVARDAQLVAVRVLDSEGEGTESDLAMGLEYVYGLHENGHSIAAVNMSLSGELHSSPCDHRGGAVRAMFEQLRAVGIAPVVATGNNEVFGAIGFPSCLSSAIAVGATVGVTDSVALYSNNSDMVDLLAPGGPIESSVRDGKFSTFAGTSMAAPHVAGAFAIMRSRYPDADLETLLLWLKLTGLPVAEVVAGSEIVNPRVRLEVAIEAHAAAPDADTYRRLMGSTQAGSSGSSGGCALGTGRPDPLLPLLLVSALAWLWRRRA